MNIRNLNLLRDTDTVLKGILFQSKKNNFDWKAEIQNHIDNLFQIYRKNPGLFKNIADINFKSDISVNLEKVNQYIKRIKHEERKFTKKMDEIHNQKWDIFEKILLRDPSTRKINTLIEKKHYKLKEKLTSEKYSSEESNEKDEYDALIDHFYSRYDELLKKEINHSYVEKLESWKLELKKNWKNSLIHEEQINLLTRNKNEYTRKAILFQAIKNLPLKDSNHSHLNSLCPSCSQKIHHHIYLCPHCGISINPIDETLNAKVRYLNELIQISDNSEESTRKINNIIKKWNQFLQLIEMLKNEERNYETILIEQNQDKIFNNIDEFNNKYSKENIKNSGTFLNMLKDIDVHLDFLNIYLPK